MVVVVVAVVGGASVGGDDLAAAGEAVGAYSAGAETLRCGRLAWVAVVVVVAVAVGADVVLRDTEEDNGAATSRAEGQGGFCASDSVSVVHFLVLLTSVDGHEPLILVWSVLRVVPFHHFNKFSPTSVTALGASQAGTCKAAAQAGAMRCIGFFSIVTNCKILCVSSESLCVYMGLSKKCGLCKIMCVCISYLPVLRSMDVSRGGKKRNQC